MEKLEVNKHIPFGVTMQDILNHPSLTDSKLKYLLRLRGIFIENCKSTEIYPLLLSTILSPIEFEFIKENIRGKESTPKIQSRPIEWHDSSDLIDVVPDLLDLKQIAKESGLRYNVISQTNFAPIDGDRNKVKMQFKCQTNNYNSSWYRTKNEYEGEIIIEKIKDNNKVYLKMIYTSPETQSVADLGVKYLTSEFKQKKYTKPNAEIEKNLYNNFSNKERISFFLSLTDSNDVFEFQRVTDIAIAPDLTLDMPSEIKRMMTGRVNTLKIEGESLHENFLINEPENHQYIELAEIEALYNFSYHAASGNCVIRFGFSGYFKKRLTNIEFSLDVSSINLKDEYKHVNKDKTRLFLLQEFERFKTIKYSAIKKM